jgi:hypothetical protein
MTCFVILNILIYIYRLIFPIIFLFYVIGCVHTYSFDFFPFVNGFTLFNLTIKLKFCRCPLINFFSYNFNSYCFNCYFFGFFCLIFFSKSSFNVLFPRNWASWFFSYIVIPIYWPGSQVLKVNKGWYFFSSDVIVHHCYIYTNNIGYSSKNSMVERF